MQEYKATREIKMNLNQFITCLRHINCMGQDNFIQCFGDTLGEHLFDKLINKHKRDAAKFLMYLDCSNISALETYLNNYLKEWG
jgi:hypothetical protein